MSEQDTTLQEDEISTESSLSETTSEVAEPEGEEADSDSMDSDSGSDSDSDSDSDDSDT